MKCPKCGHENAEGEVFCEKCDWKLNTPYKEVGNFNKVLFTSFGGIVFGLASLLVSFLHYGIYGAVFGGIGLLLSSFGQTYIRASGFEGNQRTVFMIITTVGLISSVVGFIYGFVQLV